MISQCYYHLGSLCRNAQLASDTPGLQCCLQRLLAGLASGRGYTGTISQFYNSPFLFSNNIQTRIQYSFLYFTRINIIALDTQGCSTTNWLSLQQSKPLGPDNRGYQHHCAVYGWCLAINPNTDNYPCHQTFIIHYKSLFLSLSSTVRKTLTCVCVFQLNTTLSAV